MAGLLKPAAAKKLIETLKQEIGLPIHLHTHDTSGAAAATIMAAVDAGVDAVDAAMDALSGTTSQPTLGSLVAALERRTARSGARRARRSARSRSTGKRCARSTAPSRATCARGASEVYLHEMPGGQFTNLKEQARSLGLESRWHEVAQTYADVNQMFGDIVKVTPSSKVVGDMALAMVSSGPHARRCRGPEPRSRLPEFGRRLLRRRSRPAARRLPQGAAEEGAEGQDAADRAARLLSQGCRPRGRAQRRPPRQPARRDRRQAPRLVPHVSQGLLRLRRRRRTVRADARCCRRRSISTGWSRARSSSSRSRRARRWSSTISAAPRPTRRARSASSSTSTASRAPSPCRTG